MRNERRNEVERRKNQSYRPYNRDLKDATKEAKEKDCTLEEMIEDDYMIKCEGCNQLLHTDTFFRHASRAKRCKEAYGPRLEAMQKEKRRDVKAFSYKKNQAKSKDYYLKNKEKISEQKKERFQENKLKKKEAKEKKDRYFKLFDEYNELTRKFTREIAAVKITRMQMKKLNQRLKLQYQKLVIYQKSFMEKFQKDGQK